MIHGIKAAAFDGQSPKSANHSIERNDITMKKFTNIKKIFTFISAALVLIAVLGAASVFAATAIIESNSIGIDNAINIAINTASVSGTDIDEIEAKLKFRNAAPVYIIELGSGANDYEFIINAEDGSIIDFILNTHDSAQAPSDTAATPGNDKADDKQNIPEVPTEIDKELLLSAALLDAGLNEADVTLIKIEYDEIKNGYIVYEVKFKTADSVYEYEVREDGVVIQRDIDKNNGKDKTETSVPAELPENMISADDAKRIALEHAALTEAEIKFSKAKLDYDDGNFIYELEFKLAGIEYEYEINASTGEILEFESENDD